MHSNPIFYAFFIGFLIGIVIYSVAVNTWGFATLIPLFLVYLLIKKPKKGKPDRLLSLAILLALSACAGQRSTLLVPANRSVALDFPDYPAYTATLKNKGSNDVEVAVFPKSGAREQVRGFGLGSKGKADVLVEQANQLVLRNPTDRALTVALSVRPTDPASARPAGETIGFTLRNSSAASIPLIIPNVMNPNLSPFSNSGVNLKLGQEILFREKGKTYVLLVVDASIEEGAVLDVPKLLTKRRTELGLN